MDETQILLAEMKLPSSLKLRILAAVGWGIVAVFLVLAAVNIVFWRSISPISLGASILWLMLAPFMVRVWIRQAGSARQFLVDAAGVLSTRQFVAAVQQPDVLAVCFGFELFGRRYRYIEIPADTIEYVDWSAGQASGMAGRDMNDWQVILWHHPKMPSLPYPRKGKVAPYFFGTPRSREKTEALGREFLAFLKSVGIGLRPTKKGKESCRTEDPNAQSLMDGSGSL
jgi:hypothetical protein